MIIWKWKKFYDKYFLSKDPYLIPQGSYCCNKCRTHFGQTVKIGNSCPYWSSNKHKKSEESGYCAFMQKGDWDNKYGGLLWMQCKECGINQ